MVTKNKIFLRGVNEVLMIDASFEEVKFAINNDLQIFRNAGSKRTAKNSNLIFSKSTQHLP